MDYQRIYTAFIEDRKQREAGLIGYVERHHILPRCMGGGDDAENLIRLTPEDHFFAHLLLAKVHGGGLWAAVRIMAAAALGEKVNHRRLRLGQRLFRLRRRYAIGREWANLRLIGEDHPSADKARYRWRHVDGRTERLTRQGLARKHGFPAINLNPVVSGRSDSVFGWYLPSKNPNGRIGPKKGIHHPAADLTEYQFFNLDGHSFKGTRVALCERFQVPRLQLMPFSLAGADCRRTDGFAAISSPRTGKAQT